MTVWESSPPKRFENRNEIGKALNIKQPKPLQSQNNVPGHWDAPFGNQDKSKNKDKTIM